MNNLNIEVKEFQIPKCVINHDTLKAELEKSLADYKGLVVTEETLPACKDAQKELANLRTKIDKARKEKKKELEKPIKAFENQCKELIALIEQVEQPIKDGIKVFDDMKREEKKKVALKIIEEAVLEHGLTGKFAANLDVLPKYMNLTATKKEVKEDVDTRAFALKLEQDRELEKIEILKGIIEAENKRLKTKLDLSMWQSDIDAGVKLTAIHEKINSYANKLYEAENQQIEPPKEVEPPEPPQSKNEPQYTATFKVYGTKEQLQSVSKFLKDNGIAYEVSDQRTVGVM